MTVAEVCLWGTRIGAVSWDTEADLAAFEYTPEFQGSGIELAPLRMPLGSGVFRFPELGRSSFSGLPGMLADALPDRFGNALIDSWLASRGQTPERFDPVQRLCYVGSRGMGALEFVPALHDPSDVGERLDVASLVELASAVLMDRAAFTTRLREGDPKGAVRDILRVGTSAGGARAKAVVAWNPRTGELRSGQAPAAAGFGHWLLKFDGVSANRDKELADPAGYGLVEYAYSLMAGAAGIEMSECRLLREGGRSHFMTRRFDRTEAGARLHMQTLSALMHLDFDLAGAHSYEQALQCIRRLELPMAAVEEQLRRAVFNVLARNQDDHVKNISFLMDKKGLWSLSPAYDVTYAYNPLGTWTSRHQMTIGGKRDSFQLADFERLAKVGSMKRGRARVIFDEVLEAVRRWSDFAEEAGVPEQVASRIQATLRTDIAP